MLSYNFRRHLLVLAVVSLHCIVHPSRAIATVVFTRADVNTIGCDARDDLLDVMRTGDVYLGTIGIQSKPAAMIKMKVAQGKCFIIGAGKMVISAPEWQSRDDIGRNISKLATKSGRSFYSTMVNWTYAGDVPDFVE